MDSGEFGAQAACFGLLFSQGLFQTPALRGVLRVAYVQRGLRVGGHTLKLGLFRFQGLASFLTEALEFGLLGLEQQRLFAGLLVQTGLRRVQLTLGLGRKALGLCFAFGQLAGRFGRPYLQRGVLSGQRGLAFTAEGFKFTLKGIARGLMLGRERPGVVQICRSLLQGLGLGGGCRLGAVQFYGVPGQGIGDPLGHVLWQRVGAIMAPQREGPALHPLAQQAAVPYPPVVGVLRVAQ